MTHRDDVIRYYFRSTMEELQRGVERGAVTEAQAQLDKCTKQLQQLTKACGDAFSKLGEIESSWSHARSVVMSWVTIISLIGSFVGLVASFQVTKMRIETSVETSVSRTKEELVELLDKRDKKNGAAAAHLASLEAALAASNARLEAVTGASGAAGTAAAGVPSERPNQVASPSPSPAAAASPVGLASETKLTSIRTSRDAAGDAAGDGAGDGDGGAEQSIAISAVAAVDAGADSVEAAEAGGRNVAVASPGGATPTPVEDIAGIAARIEALNVSLLKLETTFAELQGTATGATGAAAGCTSPDSAAPAQHHQEMPAYAPAGSSALLFPPAAPGWNLGVGDSFVVLSLAGAILVRLLDAGSN